MSFDAASLSVRDAAAQAAAHAHPAPHAEQPSREMIGFLHYLIDRRRQFTDWPARPVGQRVES